MRLRTGRAPRRASGARGLRRTISTIGVLIPALVLVGCGSAGVHAQDPTSDPATGHPTTAMPSSPASSPSTPTWTPSAYGDAQPAVDAYLALSRASDAAFSDPAHADLSGIEAYSAGQAKYQYEQALADARKEGIAYRGTPTEHRVTVVSADVKASLPSVTLHDCGAISTDDPYTAYYVGSGAPVPTTTPSVPPPYGKTIKVFRTPQQPWRVFTITTDATKTCEP